MVFLEALVGAFERARLGVVASALKTPFRKGPAAYVAVLALFTLLLSGCGGGGTVSDGESNNSPPPPPPPPQNHFAIATYHNDNSRSGINSQESKLTPANVNVVSFGRLAAVPVQGAIFAQPLYIADVTLSDGKNHNLVIVVTEHDQVYAIDDSILPGHVESELTGFSGIDNPGIRAATFPAVNLLIRRLASQERR